jgi:hypothetical protein
MTLTGINLIHSTGSFTSSLLSVNFNPPSFPYNVDPNDFVDIELEICAGSGNVEDVLNIQPVSAEHGAESHLFSFGYPAQPITIAPSSIDFGLVEFGTTTTPVFLCFTNNSTLCGTPLLIDATDCVGISPENTRAEPDAGGLDTDCVSFTWEPKQPCEILDCDIKIDLCGTEFLIPVTGEATDAAGEPCGESCPCLCCTGIEIQTEDGRCVRDLVQTCDSESTYQNSAIGEQKSIVYKFTYDSGIGNNFEVYFNPIIWGVTCNYSTKYGGPITSPPPFGYYIELFSSMIGAGWQTMSLFNTTFNTPNQKNWIVELKVFTATTFQIRLTFFLISDLEDWISTAVFNNAPKWRRNHVFAANPPLSGPFTNSFPSVYNSNRKLCSLIYIHDPNKIVDDVVTDFECFEVKSINWTSRFFNKGLYDGPSEFIDPVFTFERNGNPVSNLSTIERTEVKFYITIPSTFGSLACIYFNLFDESTTDNTVDFLTNYNNSRSLIVNNPVISVLQNLLESPSSVTSLGGDDYEITAFIGTGLNASHQYRIFAVVYSADDTVNSFISDPLTVTTIPTPDCEKCSIETSSNWDQIFTKTESDCLRPVAKERIRHNLTISEGSLRLCFGRTFDFLDYVVSLTLNVYRRATDFPVSGKTTFFMFEQQTSNRVVGYPSNWNNTGTLIVADSGGDIVSEFTRRVGFASTPFAGANVFVADTATYMNRTPAGVLGTPYVTTLGVTNDWRSEQIIYEYVLKLDLSSIYGTPYEINYVKAFQVLAIENEPNNSGFDQKIFGFEFQCNSGGIWTTIEGPFCPNDCDSIRAIYTANESGNFAFFATPTPSGNIANVQESEDAAFNLPQQLNVISLDLTYSPFLGNYQAIAILDPSTLTSGLSYELCGYWSKLNE